MSTVYSTQFFQGDVAAGATVTAFTVPAGFVYVVRSITMGPFTSGNQSAQFEVNGVPILNLSYNNTQVGPTGQGSWQGNMVLNPGQAFQIFSGQHNGFNISGFKLTLP